MTVTPIQMLQFSQHYSRFYARQFSTLLARTDLSMREVHVLLFLANNPAYDTARDISLYRGLAKSQVSQAVDILLERGVLHRSADTQDHRILHLSITKAGKPLARECQQIQESCNSRLLEELSPEEVTQLDSLLKRVLDHGMQLSEEVSF